MSQKITISENKYIELTDNGTIYFHSEKFSATFEQFDIFMKYLRIKSGIRSPNGVEPDFSEMHVTEPVAKIIGDWIPPFNELPKDYVNMSDEDKLKNLLEGHDTNDEYKKCLTDMMLFNKTAIHTDKDGKVSHVPVSEIPDYERIDPRELQDGLIFDDPNAEMTIKNSTGFINHEVVDIGGVMAQLQAIESGDYDAQPLTEKVLTNYISNVYKLKEGSPAWIGSNRTKEEIKLYMMNRGKTEEEAESYFTDNGDGTWTYKAIESTVDRTPKTCKGGFIGCSRDTNNDGDCGICANSDFTISL